jgi:hypothetical protein
VEGSTGKAVEALLSASGWSGDVPWKSCTFARLALVACDMLRAWHAADSSAWLTAVLLDGVLAEEKGIAQFRLDNISDEPKGDRWSVEWGAAASLRWLWSKWSGWSARGEACAILAEGL